MNLKKILLFVLLPLQGILLSFIAYQIIIIPIGEGDPHFLYQIWFFFNFIPNTFVSFFYIPFYFERDWHQYDWFTIPTLSILSNLIFWLIIAYVFRDIGSKLKHI